MITSKDNKRIKNVISLVEKSKERRKQNVFVVEGTKMFSEAPTNWIKEVYISDDYEATAEKTIVAKLNALRECEDVFVETVTSELFRKMSDTKTPQGILSILKRPDYDISHFYKSLEQRSNGLYLILEDIQDPGNLGTMLRAGEGAGIQGVIMSKNTVDVYNPKTIRATMGSIYRMPFYYVDDLADCIKKIKKMDVHTYAAHLKGTESYDQFDYKKNTAFLIGNEGNGLSDEIASLAETYVIIPMLGEVESLNAAVAAMLLSYEAARQRR